MPGPEWNPGARCGEGSKILENLSEFTSKTISLSPQKIQWEYDRRGCERYLSKMNTCTIKYDPGLAITSAFQTSKFNCSALFLQASPLIPHNHPNTAPINTNMVKEGESLVALEPGWVLGVVGLWPGRGNFSRRRLSVVKPTACQETFHLKQETSYLYPCPMQRC